MMTTLQAYRLVGGYTIESVNKAIDDISNSKESEPVKSLLVSRKQELEQALEIIQNDLENS